MKNTILPTILVLITSACGIHSARPVAQPDPTNLTDPDPVPTDTVQTTMSSPSPSQNSKSDLVLKNLLSPHHPKHLLDRSTGATFTLLGKTSNELLSSTIKNGQSRVIGKLSLKVESLMYDQRYESEVSPTVAYATNPLNIDVTIIKDGETDDLWVAIPKMYESALATMQAPIVVESKPAIYCAKAYSESKGVLPVKTNYECTPDGNCITRDQFGYPGTSKLSNAYNSGGYCLSNNTYYQKKETKHNSISPILALIEMSQDDPTQLKWIQINLK